MFKSRKSTPLQIAPLAPPPGVVSTMQASGNGSSPTTYTAGNPMERVGSYNSDSVRIDKMTKRRSGLFGLGKKDKERGREEVREEVSHRLGRFYVPRVTGTRPEGGALPFAVHPVDPIHPLLTFYLLLPNRSFVHFCNPTSSSSFDDG